MTSATDTAGHEINLLLPESATRPLWRHLLGELRDHFFPEKFPPLHLSSRPVNLGMLLGDYVTLPWYRTVFINIGNVITPDVQAPLELESRPVDVGELINDQLSHPWWTSLLRNLADRVAPERMAPLELTSKPADAHGDKLRGALSRSRIRQGMLIAIAIGEALYLIAAGLGLI